MVYGVIDVVGVRGWLGWAEMAEDNGILMMIAGFNAVFSLRCNLSTKEAAQPSHCLMLPGSEGCAGSFV